LFAFVTFVFGATTTGSIPIYVSVSRKSCNQEKETLGVIFLPQWQYGLFEENIKHVKGIVAFTFTSVHAANGVIYVLSDTGLSMRLFFHIEKEMAYRR
jgi:hypothetical protein